MIFFLKKVGLFSIPFLFSFISFFLVDPFKILYHYDLDEFSFSNVTLNPDYISTEKYLRNRRKYQYDSFIFGSSRTMGFRTWDWKRHIDSNKTMVFHAAGESVFGMHGKFKLIEKQRDTIKNALLLFDNFFINKVDDDYRHIFIKHPLISNSNGVHFYFQFLKTYLDIKFLYALIDYSLSNNYKPYMKAYLKKIGNEYTIKENDWIRPLMDKEINEDSLAFYSNLMNDNVFYDRDLEQSYFTASIKAQQIKFLKEIYSILKKNETNYKIILLPMYDQYKFNIKDIKILQNIFGKGNIYDFSGKNKYTKEIGNYYEPEHFRDNVGKQILDSIY